MKLLKKKTVLSITAVLVSLGLTAGAIPAYAAEIDTTIPQEAEEGETEYNMMNGITDFNVGTATLPSSGDVSVLGIYISFPDQTFEEGDTAEAFQNLFTGSADPSDPNYPYESLQAYYQRASYGQLNLTGKVYTYTAKNERSDYDNDDKGNLSNLVLEALEALDGTIDYSDYDADHDGVIDAIYIHYAGGCPEGWATTFWSQAFLLESEESFDGLKAGGCISLHCESNTSDGAATIIHETGHALGLPDLYYYSENGDVSQQWRTGTCTWDMMENNCGDIDAYCKWLLGWISYDDITRVVANQSGVKVYKGNTLISSSTDGSSAEVALSTFDNSNLTDTGGFIIVSNTDAQSEEEAKYSNFFLITLEQYAQNQSLVYGEEDNQIPTGFRVYKIQGERDENDRYIHSNCVPYTAGEHNVLIECMDFDSYDAQDHITSVNSSVPYKESSSEYGCYLPENFLFNYASSPCTTNFQESVIAGFTGIWMKNTGVDTAAGTGTIEIGYSDEGRVEVPDTISLTCDNPNGMIDHATLQFTTEDYIASINESLSPKIYIDDKTYEQSCLLKDSHTIVLNTDLLDRTDRLTSNSQITAVFPAGMFLLGYDEDKNPVYNSEDIEVSVPIGPVADFEEVRTAGDMNLFTAKAISNTLAVDDNVYEVCWDEGLQLVVMERTSPENGKILPITGYSASDGAQPSKSAVYAAGQDAVIAVIHYDDGSNQLLWINTATGKVTAEKQFIDSEDLSFLSESCYVPGDGKFYYQYHNDGEDEEEPDYISCYYAGKNGLVEETAQFDTTGAGDHQYFKVYTSYTDPMTGEAELLFDFTGYEGEYDTHTIVPISGSNFYSIFHSGLKTGISVDAIYNNKEHDHYYLKYSMDCCAYKFSFTENGRLLALLQTTETDDNGNTTEAYLLEQYDKTGTQLSRIKVVSALNMDNIRPNDILFGENGQLAIIGTSITGTDIIAHHEVILLNQNDLSSNDSTIDCAKYICIDNPAVGYWMDSQYFVAFAEWAISDSEDVAHYQADLIKVGDDVSKGTGVYKNENGWWYYKDGKIQYDYTGIQKNENGWWRIVNGKVDFTATGVYKNEYGWWYCKNGKVQFNYTGIQKNENGWWRIVNGKVDFTATGVYKNEYGWWYCKNGKVQFDYTGIQKNEYGWWRIVNGKVDFTATGVYKNEYGWWYCKNGKVDFGYKGLASNSYGTWYIVNGKVQFGYTGNIRYNGKTYYVVKGKVK